MEKEEWEKIKQHYNFLIDLNESAQEEYVLKVEKKDSKLAERLRNMLKADLEEETFLEKPALSKLKEIEEPDYFIGKEIDRYLLKYLIGIGGMGNVYLAERTDLEAHQQVVVKIMNTGYLSKSLRQRFDLERRILSRLNHPHITRIYDGGITDQGLPYIVMEYIDGKPLMEYIKDEKLSLDERLELFIDIAEAVSYAHQNFIMHRDLKPANILVNRHGIVKVIDFGIAKIMADEEDIQNQITQTGIIPMTPAYASPEQLSKKPLTIATDIYSLGVVLYEMLTQNKPFPVGKNTDYSTIEKWVVQRDALKPSSSISPELEATVNKKNWKKKLSGDLDNIILKTLKKNPEERYFSVGHLVDDINRHRNNYPVIARPDKLGYRINRYIKRHKVGVAASFILFLVLVGGISSTLWQAEKVRKERDVAQYEAAKSRQITDFVVELFETSDPDLKVSDTITAETMLRKGAENLNKLKDQPKLYSEMLRVIGRLYRLQRMFNPSKEFLEKSLEIAEEVYGNQHLETAITKVELASTLHYLNEDEVAIQYLLDAKPIFENEYGVYSTQLARILYHLGQFETNKGNYSEALNYLTEAENSLTHSETLVEKELEQLLNVYNRIGRVRFLIKDYVTAIEYYQKSLVIGYQIEGEISQNVSINYYNLSNAYLQMEEIDSAEVYIDKSLEISKKLFGAEAEESFHIVASLYAAIKLEKGEIDVAADYARQAINASISVFGLENFNTGISMFTYGDILMAQEKYDEAEKYFKEATSIFENILGDSHPSYIVIYDENAQHYAKMRKWQKAIEYMRKTIASHQQFSPEASLELVDYKVKLAEYLRQSDPNNKEIEMLLQECLEVYKKEKGEEDETTLAIAAELDTWNEHAAKTGQSINPQK